MALTLKGTVVVCKVSDVQVLCSLSFCVVGVVCVCRPSLEPADMHLRPGVAPLIAESSAQILAILVRVYRQESTT